MSGILLSPGQRDQLQGLLHQPPSLRCYRRALALLALDDGRTVTEVADLLGVSRQAVHAWVATYRLAPGPQALFDHYGPGRPASWTGAALDLLRAALRRRPNQLGYPAPTWTVPLLRDYLGRQAGVWLSGATLRRGRRRLGAPATSGDSRSAATHRPG